MTKEKKGTNLYTPIFLIILITLVGGLIYYGSSVQQTDREKAQQIEDILQNQPQQRESVASNPYEIKLEVESWTWRTEHGFAIVEGEVKNISEERLNDVEVIVRFYTDDRVFITSASAMIDYQPILSNQTSAFTAYATYNPEMKSANIEFKELMGTKIYHK